MNAEELRLVLDTIKDVANTAGYAGSLWIVVHYLTAIIVQIVWPIAIVIGSVKIARYIFEVQRHTATQADPNEIEKTKRAEMELAASTVLNQLFLVADRAGFKCSRYTGMYSSDLEKLLAHASTLKEKEKA